MQGGHEHEGDGFGLLVPGLRAEARRARAEAGIGIRLQPQDVAQPGRLGRSTPVTTDALAGRRPAARLALRQRLVAIRYSHVRTDARPSRIRGSPATPRTRVLLDRILGVLERSEHPVAVHVELAAVPFGRALGNAVTIPGLRFFEMRSAVTTLTSRHLLPVLYRTSILYRHRPRDELGGGSARDRHSQRSLRGSREGIGSDLGTVPTSAWTPLHGRAVSRTLDLLPYASHPAVAAGRADARASRLGRRAPAHHRRDHGCLADVGGRPSATVS